MFFSLGLKNAWRNRGRTALGIVSMAVAAVIFLSSSTLSRGYPGIAFFEARQLLGGDILLLPGKTALSREDLATGGYAWRFQKKSLDRPDLALGFDTTPYAYGTIQGFPVSGDAGVNRDRYLQVLSSLQANGAVKTASIRQSLPFLMQVPATAGPTYAYGFLDARNVAEDLATWRMDSTVAAGGGYLDPGDPGMTGVACSGWAALQLRANMPVNVEIPRYTGRTASDGAAYVDYENYSNASLKIKGVASFAEGGGYALRIFSEPAVFVSSSTFATLSQSAGYPDEATYWGISVTVKDMSELENVAGLLRREYPDFTTLPVSQLAGAKAARTSVSSGVPMDMRQVTEAIAFITAALLSATNLTVIMLSRKNEIGILRAIGATGWNIAWMVLTESVCISLLGALAGSIFTQPAILWQLLSNRIAVAQVAEIVGRGIGRAVAFAACTAVVFGFLPVARALRVTPAQVLRGE